MRRLAQGLLLALLVQLTPVFAPVLADEVDLKTRTLLFTDSIRSIRVARGRKEITFANHPSVYVLPANRVQEANKLKKLGKPVSVQVSLKSSKVLNFTASP